VITALAVKSIRIVEQHTSAAKALLVDADSDIDGAIQTVQRLSASKLPVIVCISGLEIEGINRLISAGASDVLGYPIAGDCLAKKMDRAIRRRR
jgi:DNA-binding NtrC family response regulator